MRESRQRRFIRRLQDAILGRDNLPRERIRNRNHSDRAVYGSRDRVWIKRADWIGQRINLGWGGW